MSSAALNATAVSQVSDAALIAEMNIRLKAGIIEPDALDLPEPDDGSDALAAGGGYGRYHG